MTHSAGIFRLTSAGSKTKSPGVQVAVAFIPANPVFQVFHAVRISSSVVHPFSSGSPGQALNLRSYGSP
ncbi:hypothetical protein D1614_04995 [Maribellus luteus]|uniref:Uncharacterized protein n=1 Tax=Maribellus luteus TaxID=2305463 RepID=A0A399T585_9BACT|nr:hypothetical protein D1614_04995 [Maribellus luteus]